MKPEIYQQIQKKYGSKFVALLGDKVAANGATFKELIEDLRKKGLDGKDLIFEYIDPEGATVVYRVPL